jgi:hypothetical protein
LLIGDKFNSSKDILIKPLEINKAHLKELFQEGQLKNYLFLHNRKSTPFSDGQIQIPFHYRQSSWF